MNLLIKAGLILTFDGAGTVLEGGEILVEDGAIAAVGSRVNLEGRPPARVIDARDALVMPGLVNAHTHSSENLRKGCGDLGSLAEWLPKVIIPLDNLDPEANHIAALLGCGAMLRSGTTTVLDHFRRLPLQGANVDAVTQAYEKAGIRAVLAPTVRDRSLYEPSVANRRQGRAPRQMEEPLGQPVDAQLALCEEAIRKWHGRAGRLQIFLGPSGPQRCSDELLQGVRELAEKHDVGIHTHLAETRWQAIAGKALYGTTLTAHLDELGLLSPRLSVAHAVWLERDDIRRLGQARVSAVHNPVSNLKLGSGIAKVAQMRRAGVNVALGSDGAASNDSQEMFEVVKLAAILSRLLTTRSSQWVSASAALEMAIRGGAVATRNELRTGSLEPGKRADLIIIGLDDHSLRPLNDAVAQLVYCNPARSVRTVLVDGRAVVEDGQVLTFDEEEVFAEAQAIASRLPPAK